MVTNKLFAPEIETCFCQSIICRRGQWEFLSILISFAYQPLRLHFYRSITVPTIDRVNRDQTSNLYAPPTYAYLYPLETTPSTRCIEKTMENKEFIFYNVATWFRPTRQIEADSTRPIDRLYSFR